LSKLDGDGVLGGEYFFHRKIPLIMPSSFVDSLLYRVGYLPKDYVLRRESLMLEAFNSHLRDTVIRDRQILLDNIMREKNNLSLPLIEQIENLRRENERLRGERQ
jgi:hypothetical protein